MVPSLRSLCLQVVHDNLDICAPSHFPEDLANDFAKLSLKEKTVERTHRVWGNLSEFCPEYNISENTLQAILRTYGPTLKRLDLPNQLEFKCGTFGEIPFPALQQIHINASRMLPKELKAFLRLLPAEMEQVVLRECKRLEPLLEAATIPKRVRFVSCTITSEQLTLLCEKTTHVLEALFFDRCTLKGVSFNIPMLSKVTMCGVAETVNGDLFLKALSKVCQETIIHLDVRSTYEWHEFTSLQSLLVHNFAEPTDYWLQEVSKQCGKTLRVLHLKECYKLKFGSDEFTNLEEFETSHIEQQNLEELGVMCGTVLKRLTISDINLSHISTFNFPALEYLEIWASDLTNDDLQVIAEGCGKTLQSLVFLGSPKIESIDMSLFPKVKTFSSRKKITLL